jgi:hypothetical protein
VQSHLKVDDPDAPESASRFFANMLNFNFPKR